MSAAVALLMGGITLGGMYAIRHASGKGQAKWVANILAEATGKPTINIGAKRDKWGDIKCDIEPHGGVIYANIESMPQFADKTFSVALVSHVIEHVEHPEDALKEVQRIADNVVVILPSPLDIATWVDPQHKWVFFGGSKVRIDPSIIAAMMTTIGLGVLIGIGCSRRKS